MPATPAVPPSKSLPIRGHRFAIVGGASLVGAATARHLLDQGAGHVVIADNFYQGSKAALDGLDADPRVSVVTGDVLRLPEMLAALDGADGVLHLAALMTISMDRDPWLGIDVNVRGAQNAIEACCVRGVKKLVFASSNAVYGYGPGIAGDLVETTPFHSAGAPPAAILYGASKIMGEQLARDAHVKRGLDYVVLRYSTVYGERQHYRAANALFIIETLDRLRRGEAPRVIGDGAETKHFVNVADVARANACAFAADATDIAVNISGPRPVTTLDLVTMVARAAGRPIAPIHVEPEPGKVRLTSGGPWRIDHAHAKRMIDWSPEIEMEEGLRRLIAWYDTATG